MHLKKFLLLLLTLVVALGSVACTVTSNPISSAPESESQTESESESEVVSQAPSHTCVWDTAWNYDSVNHWHDCQDRTCDLKDGLAKHEFVNGFCYVCDAQEQPYALKLAQGQTITIDGTIDSVWEGGYTYIMQYELDGKSMTVDPAEAKVMWDATGLYFMAKVYDNTIVDADRVDFWVSETYQPKMTGDGVFTPDAVYGEYVLGLRNDLVFREVAGGYDATEDCQFAVKAYEGYYVVEAYMPKITSGTYSVGHELGLEICTNHYDDDVSGRKFCVPWNMQGFYWENPAVLNKVILVDQTK